jgi:hypothetical protein
MIRDEIRRDVCVAMATKLQVALPAVGGPEWWKWYVVEQLTDVQREMHQGGSEGDLFALDMAALLRVYYRNWSELAAKGYLPRRQSWVVSKLIDARNRWAHEPVRGNSLVELHCDFEAMQQFLDIIQADPRLNDRVRRYKEKIRCAIDSPAGLPFVDNFSFSNVHTGHPAGHVNQGARPKEESHPAIGVADGLVDGTAESIRNASGWLIPESEFKNLGTLLRMQSEEYRTLVNSRRLRLNTGLRLGDRQLILDTLLVGGETLGAYLASGSIPDNVLMAYEMAYPNEAAQMTLVDKIGQMDEDQLVGLSSGIKGKLFEIQYVNYLEDGNLPAGFHAALADVVTNPGWDIAIRGPDSNIADVIQLKATDSVAYVKEALDRYPDIDVVSTHEVYGQLVMQGLSDNVADSGISQDALNHLIDSSIDAATPDMDFVPSPISLALIAFSVYSQTDLSEFEKSKQLGSRSAKSYLAYLAGNALTVLTNTWWLGLVGGMGSRVLLDMGRQKDARLSHLQHLVENNAKILARLRGPLTNQGSA